MRKRYSVKDIKMTLKFRTLPSFVQKYIDVYPDLSKEETALCVTRLLNLKGQFKQRVNKMTMGNTRKKFKHDISEIFRK